MLDAGGQPFSATPAPSAERAAPDRPGIRWVAVRALAAADRDGSLVENEVEGYLPFRRDWLADRGIDAARCVVIAVPGDSMAPALPEGSAVLVDRTARRLAAGRIYVVRTDDGPVVTRLQREGSGWVMRSDNPGPGPSPAPGTSEADIIGEVRWTARSIR